MLSRRHSLKLTAQASVAENELPKFGMLLPATDCIESQPACGSSTSSTSLTASRDVSIPYGDSKDIV